MMEGIMKTRNKRGKLQFCTVGILTTMFMYQMLLGQHMPHITRSITRDKTTVATTVKQPTVTEKYRKPELFMPSDFERILAKARTMNSTPILVTLINDAYLPFLYSWLCNTKGMDIHHKVLIISTTKGIDEELSTTWPKINIVTIPMNSSNGDQVFSHAGYVRLMIRRSQILLELLKNGFETFLFEVDCLWLKNPIPHMQNFSKHDMVIGSITGKPEVTGGLMYLFPTLLTQKSFHELNRKLTLLEHKITNKTSHQFVSARDNDQIYLSQIVRWKFSGLRPKILPSSDFADGMWYCLSKMKRNQSHPYLINNNWVLGNKRKILRAKMWRHWFIKDDNSCDFDQIHNIVDNWQINTYEPTNRTLYSPC